MIIRTLPTPLNLHVLFAPWYIPLPEPWPLTPVGHMHLLTLYDIIKATSPMSLIASLVASSNLFCIILYLSIVVLSAGNKSTTTTTNGEIVVGLFLDFSKAFDTVNHKILLNKLFHYDIQDIPLKWFKSYLSQRYQYVTYNNHKSTNKLIQCGVPQGSILGPLLLLLYINDLSAVSKSCLNVMFADDTNMFIAGNDINAVCTQLNYDLGLVQEWLACNKLSLNVKKTHYMVFTPWNKDIKDMDIKINNECIERVYHTKVLGVQLDAKLYWKKHIEYISTKLAKYAGILIKARKKLPKSFLNNLYYCFAYPYLIYCNHIIMQKILIRIITCSPYRAHTEPLFYANKILNIKDINFYVVSVFMYNCVSSPLPGIFTDFCLPNNEFHRHDTRNASELYVYFARLDIRKFSVRINGPNSWNAPHMLLSNPHLSAPLNTGLENTLWVWNVALRILKPRFFWLLSYVALYFHS